MLRGSREHLEASLARRGKARRAVKARRGDTLESIGRRFDLTTGDLARINGYARDHAVAAGELVIVYVDEQRRKGTVDAPAPRGYTTGDLDAHDAAIEHDASDRPDDPGDDDATDLETRPRPAKPATRRRREPSTPSSSRIPGRRRGAP